MYKKRTKNETPRAGVESGGRGRHFPAGSTLQSIRATSEIETKARGKWLGMNTKRKRNLVCFENKKQGVDDSYSKHYCNGH